MEEIAKKKKKKKRLPPVWVPVPEPKQMYPHTHYVDRELNLNWIYSVMGILRSWDMSLTHLLLKLADLHNADIEKIVSELQKLLDKIKSWIAALETALNAYFTAEKEFQQAAILEAESLVLLTQTIDTAIKEITPVLQALFECIENTLKKHDSYFEEIMENINNIYADIQNIQNEINRILEYINEIFETLENLISNNINTKTLTYGTDYSLTWYNGFGPQEGYGMSNANAPKVTSAITQLKAPDKTYYTNTIQIISGTSNRVSNSRTVTPGVKAAPLFAHGSSAADVPESRIVLVTLLDADLKSRKPVSTTIGNSAVFNMLPRAARASWDCNVNLETDAGTILIKMSSISDGYNQQYYNRYDRELTFGLLNFTPSCNYSYSK